MSPNRRRLELKMFLAHMVMLIMMTTVIMASMMMVSMMVFHMKNYGLHTPMKLFAN